MTVPWVWSEARHGYVSLDDYWRRYKVANDAPTVADLAAEAKITPSTLSGLLVTHYGKRYRDIAESRRSGKSQVLLSDQTYRQLFRRYKARNLMTLKELGHQEKVSASILSTHFRRLFGSQYEAIASRRRAHV